MSGTDFEYAAFISYNSADRIVARRLQRSLESYSIPASLRGQTTDFGLIGERIGKVCRDRTDFKSGESLSAALAEALDKSSSLIVLCSPDSAASKWVNAEVEHFKETGRSPRIFPIVARTDETGSIPNSFPPALRRADGDEAIAADLQQSGDGWQDAVLKTLASILDVEYDGLRQRALVAARRRARFAFAVAGGMAALSVATGIAGVVAFTQRNRALSNFEDAILISARAASRINQLNDETKVPRELIHRFLTETDADLRDISSLEAMSRHPRVKRIGVEYELLLSDLYAEVGRSKDQLASSLQARQWMNSIESDVNDPMRKALSSVIYGEMNAEYFADELSGEVAQSLGAAHLSNGDLKGARSEFDHCYASNLAAVRDWELDQEELLEFRSDALSCAAQLANVLAILNEPSGAIALLETALKAQLDSNLSSTAYPNIVLAQLYADNSRLGESIAVMDEEISKRREPGGRQERIELAKFLETRAKAREITGRFADSITDLEHADRVLEEFLTNDANDRRVLLVRAEVSAAAGEVFARAGERRRADDLFNKADLMFGALIAFDENRRDWRLARAKLRMSQADNALRIFEQNSLERKELQRAIENGRAAIEDIGAVVTAEDSIAARLEIVATVSQARVLRLSGDLSGAGELLREASSRLDAQKAHGPSPPNDLLTALLADEKGDLASFSGAHEEAGRQYDQSISLQRAYLAKEPAASIVIRDLVWTELADARNLIAAGDQDAARRRLASACSLKSSAALKEYSLFERDSQALEAAARDLGVAC